MQVRPDIHTLLGFGDSRFANSVSAGKAERLLAGNRCLVLTGVVITNPETEERYIIDNARFRWIDRDDWYTLFNPPHISHEKPTLGYQVD